MLGVSLGSFDLSNESDFCDTKEELSIPCFDCVTLGEIVSYRNTSSVSNPQDTYFKIRV